MQNSQRLALPVSKCEFYFSCLNYVISAGMLGGHSTFTVFDVEILKSKAGLKANFTCQAGYSGTKFSYLGPKNFPAAVCTSKKKYLKI